jgi:heme exporter protein B
VVVMRRAQQSLWWCLVCREMAMVWSDRAQVLQSLVFYAFLAMLPVFVQYQGMPLQEQAPGALWVAAMLSLLLTLPRMLVADYQDGCLDQLLLGSAVWQVLSSKLLAMLVLQMVPMMAITPLCGVLMHMQLDQVGILMVTLALGMPVLLLLGFFMATLLLTCRHQALLLGLLLLPLMLPPLLFSVGLLHDYMHGGSVASGMLMLAGVLCLAMAVCPWMSVMALRLYDVRGQSLE